MKRKPKLLLIWHEAGNPIYFDRFLHLSEHYDLTVFGFSKFQGVDFSTPTNSNKFRLILDKPWLSGHWLTVFSFGLLRCLFRNKFDYIYIHEEPHSVISFFSTLLSSNAKTIIDAAIINKKLYFKGYNPFEKYVYKNIDAIFYRNNDVKQVLRERGGKEDSLVSAIGNGVSTTIFNSLSKPPKTAYKKLTVGFAGRIWKWKGLELLISLKKQCDINIKVCGPVVDEWLKKDLLDNGIEVLEKLNGQDLTLFYQSLDLFILPSLEAPGWSEQFGRVVVESVFSGTPALGSTTGFIPNLVGDDGKFKSGCDKQLIELVLKFSSEAKREQLYSEQYARLSNEYSWAGIAAKVKYHLERI